MINYLVCAIFPSGLFLNATKLTVSKEVQAHHITDEMVIKTGPLLINKQIHK